MSFQSLEFDRVLALVASFARSARGHQAVVTTLPRFDAAEGSLAFRRSRELAALLDRSGPLAFPGLDAADLLECTSGAARDGVEIARLVSFARTVVEVRNILLANEPGPELSRLAVSLPRLEGLLAYCEQRLGPNGDILDSASPALAQARAGRERHRHAIIAALEDLRRAHRQLAAPFTVRRERYCVPVPVHERSAVPGLVLDVSATANTVFLEPFSVVELNNALAQAIALARAEEERILAELSAAFARIGGELLAAATTLAVLDAAQARVLFGRTAGGRLLQPGAGDRIRLFGARHPLLDPALAPLRASVLGEPGSTRPIVPLDLDLPSGARLVLLSGPNAGGKTVALKTIGLVALMSACGIPVLADEDSSLPGLSGVWCHIGDEQNLLSDLSTFTGAMHATASLLATADSSSLVLYDELGSGTDPEEGAALAAALLEELAARGCWTIATAHLLTVAAHLEDVEGAVNGAMGFDETSGRPTYELRLGVPGRSRGLAIAAACGVPAPVLARARDLVSRSFLAIDTYLEGLQRERDRAVAQQETWRRRQHEAEEARDAARAEADRLLLERDRVKRSLEEERVKLRKRASEQLDAAIAEIEKARASGDLPGKRRLITIRRVALALDEEAGAPVRHADPFAVGEAVHLRDTRSTGTVRRVVGGRVEVQVGDKRLWVERASCEPVAGAPAAGVRTTVVAREETVPAELKLLGKTQDEAREELERFLDAALLAGQRHLRIVHGHGTGALRKLVLEVLRGHAAVASFAHPAQNRGGTGVTEVELE